jgi:hypothetical protein
MVSEGIIDQDSALAIPGHGDESSTVLDEEFAWVG